MSISKDVGLKKQLQERVEKYSDEHGELDQDGKARFTYLIEQGLDYAKWGLNLRQVLFCIYYVNDAGGSAKKAALMAGYTEAYANMAGNWVAGKQQKRNMVEFIASLTSEFGASKTQVLAFLKRLIERDFWNEAIGIEEDPNNSKKFIPYIDWKRLKETGLTSMIHEVTWNQNGSVKSLKIYDQLKATELNMQYLAMLKRQVEIRHLDDALKETNMDQAEAEAIISDYAEQYKERERAIQAAKAEMRLKVEATA